MKRIVVSNLNKKFILGFKEDKNVLARIVFFFSNSQKQKKIVKIAEDISFEVKAGENIGILGLNGCGKSTLLRLIAGIYKPDSGSISTEGSLIYLSGFGQGLQPKLSMRENIYNMATLMGLSQPEIRSKFDRIVEFSGLNEFVNSKLYQFSSGMITRLNFSVMIFCIDHQRPDILLLDEILSSGGSDIDFQNKTILKMEEFIKSGSTVVLVSHDLLALKKYCDRIIWLDNGKIRADGLPEDVISEYTRDFSN